MNTSNKIGMNVKKGMDKKKVIKGDAKNAE